MVYDIRSLKNYLTCVKLMKNSIKPVGVKTDCILFEKIETEKVRELFDTSDKIGCFKIEYGKELVGDKIRRIKNNYPEIKEINFNEHKIKNERDSKEINKVFDKYNCIVLGELAGVGKTYACSKYECKKKLFISPFNRQCHDLRKKGCDCITTHMLLGLGCNDQQNKKKRSYNIDEYDCIVFDEIFLNSPNMLTKIKKFMISNNDKKYLASGDIYQIEPIGMESLNNISE